MRVWIDDLLECPEQRNAHYASSMRDNTQVYNDTMNKFSGGYFHEHPSMASHARPLHGGYNFDERPLITNDMQVDSNMDTNSSPTCAPFDEDVDSCNTDSWGFQGVVVGKNQTAAAGMQSIPRPEPPIFAGGSQAKPLTISTPSTRSESESESAIFYQEGQPETGRTGSRSTPTGFGGVLQERAQNGQGQTAFVFEPRAPQKRGVEEGAWPFPGPDGPDHAMKRQRFMPGFGAQPQNQQSLFMCDMR